MRFFLDAEFIESGSSHPIDLISIGLICEDGREYYACNKECQLWRANDWVWGNVLIPIGCQKLNDNDDSQSFLRPVDPLVWKRKSEIANEIEKFVYGTDERPTIEGYLNTKPEFWGEWCSYDWVVFAQLFGTMMDLPKGFPMRCGDIIQWAEDHLGIPSDLLPPSLETPGNHHALLGAKTVQERYHWLEVRAEKVKV